MPLGWSEKTHLASVVNPTDTDEYVDPRGRQTVELRSPDGSASFHLLLAGITTAAEYDQPGNYVAGANIAGFIKVADAMLAYGVA